MAEKEYIERETLTRFRNEVMDKFIDLCRGNDYNKLTLLRIGETIDSIFEKHSTQPAADVVEVVRCKDCKYLYCASAIDRMFYCRHHPHGLSGINIVEENPFCSYGEKMDGKDGEGK